MADTPDRDCSDCGKPTSPHAAGVPIPGAWEWYSVKDDVWETATSKSAAVIRFLCVGCIETRLGRRLRRKDFVWERFGGISPILYASPRMRSRWESGLTK